ncbi:MAG: hypothetical protein V2I97_15930 [Desulfococcaceae bacterium]|jgi:hypothetical protein|nr:hypothetical protein [Desulfococcaceae bacterium]
MDVEIVEKDGFFEIFVMKQFHCIADTMEEAQEIAAHLRRRNFCQSWGGIYDK